MSGPIAGVGQVNRYTCERCARTLVTIDRAEGFTPAMILCDKWTGSGCDGLMNSHFYRKIDRWARASHEWFRPEKDQLNTLTREMRQHVEKGGLLLRPISHSARRWQRDRERKRRTA